jgi:hypothetical protein
MQRLRGGRKRPDVKATAHSSEAGNERQEKHHEALLAALLAEPTVARAAKQAGISERTAYRTLADPAFKAEYRDARRQVVAQVGTLLQQSATDAVEVLKEVMKDKDLLPTARVSAAKAILDAAFRSSELDDLAADVAALQEVVNQLQSAAARKEGGK